MKRRRSTSGFSLIELMVALAIGLVLVAGVVSVFIGSKQTFRSQEGLGQVQEAGRFVNYLVAPYVRQAGFLADPLTYVNPLVIFDRPGPVAAGTPDDISLDYQPKVDLYRAVWGVNGSNAAYGTKASTSGVSYEARTDVLVVRFMGQDGAAGGAADQRVRTCLGLPDSGVAASGLRATHMAENVFFLSVRGTGTGNPALNSLSCLARIYDVSNPDVTPTLLWEDGPQPLLEGVQDLQILYGEDTNTADDVAPIGGVPGYFPNIYRRADQVTNWQRVVSVRMTYTVDGGERTEGKTTVGTASDPDGNFVQDGRIRRTFTTTLNIRNRLRS